jgi:hypothetical protein
MQRRSCPAAMVAPPRQQRPSGRCLQTRSWRSSLHTTLQVGPATGRRCCIIKTNAPYKLAVGEAYIALSAKCITILYANVQAAAAAPSLTAAAAHRQQQRCSCGRTRTARSPATPRKRNLLPGRRTASTRASDAASHQPVDSLPAVAGTAVQVPAPYGRTAGWARCTATTSRCASRSDCVHTSMIMRSLEVTTCCMLLSRAACCTS